MTKSSAPRMKTALVVCPDGNAKDLLMSDGRTLQACKNSPWRRHHRLAIAAYIFADVLYNIRKTLTSSVSRSEAIYSLLLLQG